MPDGPVVQQSAYNADAERIQRFLRTFHDTSIAVDGYFGPQTRSILIAWQTAESLTADGVWNLDDATRARAIIAAGNVPGISQVDDQLEVAAPAKPSEYYKVKSGDSLSKIAKQFYGDPMKYPVIFDANRPMLSDPDKIYPGQVLRIPKL